MWNHEPIRFVFCLGFAVVEFVYNRLYFKSELFARDIKSVTEMPLQSQEPGLQQWQRCARISSVCLLGTVQEADPSQLLMVPTLISS